MDVERPAESEMSQALNTQTERTRKGNARGEKHEHEATKGLQQLPQFSLIRV